MSIRTRNDNREKIHKLVYLAILTACVIALQCMASFVFPGAISINLSLVPIAIGAAVCGRFAGGWLGLVCGFIVLIDPTTAGFMTFNAWATVLVVLLKGFLSGFISGIAYSLLERFNKLLAVAVAAILAPVVNTGIFILGCILFFAPLFESVAGGNVVGYVITAYIGVNLLIEMGLNIVLTPAVHKLISLRTSKETNKSGIQNQD